MMRPAITAPLPQWMTDLCSPQLQRCVVEPEGLKVRVFCVRRGCLLGTSCCQGELAHGHNNDASD